MRDNSLEYWKYVSVRREKGGFTRKVDDLDLVEVVKKNRQVLQMKRQIKQMHLKQICESNIKST